MGNLVKIGTSDEKKQISVGGGTLVKVGQPTAAPIYQTAPVGTTQGSAGATATKTNNKSFLQKLSDLLNYNQNMESANSVMVMGKLFGDEQMQSTGQQMMQSASDNYVDSVKEFQYIAERGASGVAKGGEGFVNALGYLGQMQNRAQNQQNAETLAMWGALTGNKDFTGAAEHMGNYTQQLKDAGLQDTVSFGTKYQQNVQDKYADADITKAGQVIGDVSEVVGGMLPSIASNAVLPGSGMVVTALSAGGNAAQEAKRNGASDHEALAYGAAVGTIEAATEKIFDGVAGVFGKGAADDVIESFAKKLAKSEGTQSAIVKIANGLGEGFEEFIAEFADRVANELIIDTDNRSFMQTLGDAGYSALMGAVVGSVIQTAGSMVDGMRSDPTTLAQQTADAVITRVKAQNPTTQATLGGISQTGENLATGIPEQNDVFGAVEGLPMVEQTAQRNDRQVQLQAATSDTQRSGIIAGASDEVIAEAQRISNVTGRNILFFNQPATASGIENGYYDKQTDIIWVNSQSRNSVAQIIAHEMTHSVELADAYSELSSYVLTQIQRTGGNLQQLGAEIEALYARNGKDLGEGNERTKNINAEIVANYVAENLLTNEKSIKQVASYNPSLARRIFNWLDSLLAKIKGVGWITGSQKRTFLNDARDAYARALGQVRSGTLANPETTLSQVGEAYTEGAISEEDFDTTWDVIEEESSLAGRSMLDFWELDNSGRRYSISETTDGRSAVVVDSDILKDIDTSSWDANKKAQAKKAAKTALLAFKDGIQVNGIDYKVNKTSRDEYTRSKYTESLSKKNQDAFADKMRAATNADDIITATTSWTNDGQLDHHRNDNFVDFVHGNVLIQAGTNQYEADTVVGITDTGEYVFYDVVDMKPTNFKIKEGSPSAASGNKTLGAILGDPSRGSVAKTGQSVNNQFSISKPPAGQMVAELPVVETEPLPDVDPVRSMPTKAEQYLKRVERTLINQIGDKLYVPKYAQRTFLSGIVRDISGEYMRTGTVSQETLDHLFETAYDLGVVEDSEFYDQYKHVKNYLHTTKVNISDTIKSDIADFSSFRKRAFGTLNMVRESGIGVDMAYQELTQMAPELFPASITNPSDQLQQMYEVGDSIRIAEKSLNEHYGQDAAEFKKWVKNDFNVAVDEAIADLRNVNRYSEEKTQAKADALSGATMTVEEVEALYPELKKARREYEKVFARNLLTENDERVVGDLMRGSATLEGLDPTKNNVKGITEVYRAKQEYEKYAKQIREWNKARKSELREKADGYLRTALSWNDKKMGIQYSRETMERNIRDIIPDRATANAVIAEYFTPVHEAQAASTRTKNAYRDRVKALDLSRKPAKGNEVSEAHAVQLLGEAEDNIRMLEQSRGRMKMRDGKSLSDWKSVVDNLWAQNPNLDVAKIRGAVEEFRTIYDELFTQMNNARVRNGYEPINYRSGYFPHFQPGDGDGIMVQFGKALGIDTAVTALPTTINGLTHTFKPGIQWFGNAQERLGFNTAYDAVEGFDKYIEGVADVIHQTDNIQNLRALASQMRYRTSDDGIRKQVDAVRADTTLSEEDKNNRIEKIYESGKFTLSNFVVELEEYTNLLANKKSRADRNMEQALGRNSYNLVKALESRVAANMVAVNPASWLTNFIPLTQGNATLDRGMLLKGMWDTLKAYKTDDGIVGQSTFLTNRRGSDPIVKTWVQKASATASAPMEWIDSFTADTLVRARYKQNLKRGLSEDAAMEDADSWVAGVMADRSKGATPTLFNRSNPLTKIFTQFQLEVNNQLSYVFKDIPDEAKKKGGAAIAGMLIKFMLGAYLYDEIYEYFIGRRPALDPLGILNDTVGDLTGYELPNLVEAGVDLIQGENLSFEAEKVGTYEALSNAGTALVEELPFVGGLLGGGRVPISSALPDFANLARAATDDSWDAKKRGATAIKELTNPATYLALPFGGGQIKKAVQGAQAVLEGGSYSVDAEGNDLLQYPVYTDTPLETAGSWIGATLFGKTTLPTGRAWIESGFKTLSAKETQAYKDMREAGIGERDAHEILVAMRAADKDADKLSVVAQSAMPDDTMQELAGLVMGTKLKTEKGNDTEYAKLLKAMDTALSASEAIQMKADGLDLDKFLEFEGAGVDAREARDLLERLDQLTPKSGSDSVTDLQKYRVVVDSGMNEQDQMDALGVMMGESEFGKLQVGYDYGVVPDVYVEYKETLPEHDADGNGNYKQMEIQAAIDAMGIDDVGMKAALWQMANKGWKPKNNPYSVSVGQKVYDAMHNEG